MLARDPVHHGEPGVPPGPFIDVGNRPAEDGVQLRDLIRPDADPGVLDPEQDAAVLNEMAAHRDRAGGVPGGVIEQRGHQRAHVVGGVAEHGQFGDSPDRDLRVPLDRRCCHPDDIEQRGGETGQVLFASACQGAQIPARAPHPGDRVIDLIETVQPLRFGLVGLELVQGGAELLGQYEQVQPELVADVGPRATWPRLRQVRLAGLSEGSWRDRQVPHGSRWPLVRRLRRAAQQGERRAGARRLADAVLADAVLADIVLADAVLADAVLADAVLSRPGLAATVLARAIEPVRRGLAGRRLGGKRLIG